MLKEKIYKKERTNLEKNVILKEKRNSRNNRNCIKNHTLTIDQNITLVL